MGGVDEMKLMNAKKCSQILIYVIPSGKNLIGNRFIFRDGYNPKHTANVVKGYQHIKTHSRML